MNPSGNGRSDNANSHPAAEPFDDTARWVPTLDQAEIAAKERALIAQCWTRQFATMANRVQEYVELYEELGLEVRVEPWALVANQDPSCSECGLARGMRTIFTRQREK